MKQLISVGTLCVVMPRPCEGRAWFDTGAHRTQLETGTLALLLELMERRLVNKRIVARRVMIDGEVGMTWWDNLRALSS